jgi:hypothetical protein
LLPWHGTLSAEDDTIVEYFAGSILKQSTILDAWTPQCGNYPKPLIFMFFLRKQAKNLD